MKLNEKQTKNFFKKIQIPDDKEDCWIWLGSSISGYGEFRIDEHAHKAHKIMYEMRYGDVPNGFELHHKCGKRGCVNPDHLCVYSRSEHRRIELAARAERKRLRNRDRIIADSKDYQPISEIEEKLMNSIYPKRNEYLIRNLIG